MRLAVPLASRFVVETHSFPQEIPWCSFPHRLLAEVVTLY